VSTIAYYRVSTKDQNIENQRREIAKIYTVDHEFFDEAISGTVKGEDRSGFANMLGFVRKGDVLVVVDLDRLGRDSIDVQQNMANLKAKGVNVIITRLGLDLSTDIGGLVITILSKVAELERIKIMERANSGRERAKADGVKFGRPSKATPEQVLKLRETMSIAQVANKLEISPATVKRLQRASA
jgi:putative DNA-invertase from lambdoid prophage Rac